MPQDKMKLVFKPQEVYEELAQLQKRTLEPHEGYFRDNNGDWIIRDQNGDRVCSVSFRGKAKRGTAHDAPDPEGQEIARLIVERFNRG